MITNQSTLSAIEMQIFNNPDAIAVCIDNQSFSYQELGLCANRLANYLIRNQVTSGDIVAVHMRRSFDLLTTLLAIWKVGAAYVCLDFDTPSARLIEIAKQSQAKYIVTDPALLSTLPHEFSALTCQDPELFDCDNNYVSQFRDDSGQLAYLIYTSGSTGQPKGVLITHNNLANYIFWFNQHFQIKQDEVFSFNSSPAFDYAVTCMLAPLAAGARILITSEPQVFDIASYCEQLVNQRVTFAKWTPSYLKLLINYVEKYKPDLSALRYLMIAGEELLTNYVERWFLVYPLHTIINEYGPTETTVGITTQTVTNSSVNRDLKTVSIGKPVSNNHLYVVGSDGCLLPQGEIGELWIGGTSVGLGYYKSPALTQANFIKNPFSKKDEILYKTGDLVKKLPDESYLYVGRTDNQIKINGYRVEISEIEYCLLHQPEIDHACVIARKSRNHDLYLEAYIVLKEPIDSYNTTLLHDKISQYLPHFMIPQHYHIIDRIPLTANSKVDIHLLMRQTSDVE